ncbi:monosaccharide ABC transporter substrate-binding protein (CUT2 family) [Antricoccus suffuscus]|uniref:Monosaccharide ABC transporter substrate-binding protein (CUT2 family) n=1 Tax=Antricoccus suffuscus TaxID=1629062 RepID=A0A2T0ZVT6_9ACTN|nr:sugar ABC transporter substrate-binding protein [Antricoccus suffuscus]PRZ40475.1 monosaccharide ABC transporter substrate-binding protein (CUT2 family) [Antricoccus suffuscus]
MRNIFLRAVAVLIPAVMLLTGCTSGESDSSSGTSKSISVLTPYLGNAATKDVIDKFKAEGKKRGWDVNVTDTAGDFNKLNSAFQDAVAQKPAAIVLGSGDPTQISLGLKSAKAAGIPVFAIDAAPADGITANVTSDNADLGKKSAEEMVKLLGGKGSIVMLTHDPHPGVKARTEAAKKVFDKAGIKIIASKHVNVPGPVEDARNSVQDLLTSDAGKFTGIWGGWDEPALGATQALLAANVSNVQVVGVDGQDFAIAEIDKGGPFKATIKQDWSAIAAKTADLIAAYLKDKETPDPQEVEIPGVLYEGKQ